MNKFWNQLVRYVKSFVKESIDDPWGLKKEKRSLEETQAEMLNKAARDSSDDTHEK